MVPVHLEHTQRYLRDRQPHMPGQGRHFRWIVLVPCRFRGAEHRLVFRAGVRRVLQCGWQGVLQHYMEDC